MVGARGRAPALGGAAKPGARVERRTAHRAQRGNVLEREAGLEGGGGALEDRGELGLGGREGLTAALADRGELLGDGAAIVHAFHERQL